MTHSSTCTYVRYIILSTKSTLVIAVGKHTAQLLLQAMSGHYIVVCRSAQTMLCSDICTENVHVCDADCNYFNHLKSIYMYVALDLFNMIMLYYIVYSMQMLLFSVSAIWVYSTASGMPLRSDKGGC